jgi:hypothetical protein
VEGGEMHILTSIDWASVYIEVITVEMAEFRVQVRLTCMLSLVMIVNASTFAG